MPLGMWQVEADAFTYGEFEEGGITFSSLSVAAMNFKYGVTSNADVQILFTPYERSKISTRQFEATDSGSGPLGLRLKYNLSGNDDGSNAVALLPYVIVPTRGEDKADNTVYGLLVPVGVPLENGRALGAMAGIEQLGDIDTFAIMSATLSTPLGDAGWGGFVELFAALNGVGDDDVQAVTFDAGVVYAPKPDWQFDAGAYLGLTFEAEDWRVFAGVSTRR